MIGLDTNILVRHLAQDDPVQSAKATEIIERRLTARNPGFICVVTMVEMVWVLERAFNFPAPDIAAVIERMLQADTFVVENEQQVFQAMVAYRNGEATFADALIAALGAKAGCRRTLTFDKKAARFAGFEHVD